MFDNGETVVRTSACDGAVDGGAPATDLAPADLAPTSSTPKEHFILRSCKVNRAHSCKKAASSAACVCTAPMLLTHLESLTQCEATSCRLEAVLASASLIIPSRHLSNCTISHFHSLTYSLTHSLTPEKCSFGKQDFPQLSLEKFGWSQEMLHNSAI